MHDDERHNDEIRDVNRNDSHNGNGAGKSASGNSSKAPRAPRASRASREKLWTLTFVLLIVTTFLANISANGMHNGVSVLLNAAGSPASLSGFIVSCFAITALLARFAAGYLADNRGRKIVLYLGGLALVLGSLIGALTTDDLLLIPARVLMGFGFSMCITAGTTAAADIVPPSRLGEGMGYQGLAVAVGIAAGPIIAINLAGLGRFSLFIAFAVFSLFILVFTALCKLPKTRAYKDDLELSDDGELVPAAELGPAPKGIFKFVEKKAIAPAIVVGTFYVPLAIYFSFMALFAEQNGIGDCTLFFVMAAATMIVLRIFASKIFDLFSTNALVVPAAILGILGFALPMASHTVEALLVSGACYGLYMGVIQSALTTESLRRSPAHRRGAASATFYIGCDLGVATGAAIWGITIAELGWTITFGLAIAIVSLGIVLALVLLRSGSIMQR